MVTLSLQRREISVERDGLVEVGTPVLIRD
jgi:hypothetical protein